MFQAFCESTTLHGWTHLNRPNKILAKIVWASILVLFNCGAIGLAVITILDFLDSTTVPIVKTTTGELKDITFPSLAFSNNDQIQASFLAEIGVNTKEELDYVISEYVEGRVNDISTEERTKFTAIDKKLGKYNPKEVIMNLAQNCSDMFLMAKWKKYPEKLFLQHVGKYASDFGIYCPFLPEIEFTNGPEDFNLSLAERMRKASTGNALSGVPLGLTMLLDVETFDHKDYRMASIGWKLWIGERGSRAYFAFSSLYITPGKLM